MIRLRYLALAMLRVFALVLVVASGVIPLQASSGRWKATAWVLDLIKRRSLYAYSRAIDVPALDHPALGPRRRPLTQPGRP